MLFDNVFEFIEELNRLKMEVFDVSGICCEEVEVSLSLKKRGNIRIVLSFYADSLPGYYRAFEITPEAQMDNRLKFEIERFVICAVEQANRYVKRRRDGKA